MASYPQRVVCLTAETVEICYALGAGDRVVGVSGYAVRPPEARRKPKVSAFTSAKLDRILALEPDLVLTFSDLQRDIARDLVGAGLTVLALNQRTLAETWQAILLVGGILGLPGRAEQLVDELQRVFEEVRVQGASLPRQPRVLFEEWDDPLISGIAWVSEIIELAGGEDIFRELRDGHTASERIVAPAEAARRDPEVIIASWCGKKVVPERVRSRPGWAEVSAVREGRIYEVKAPDILQPGPSLIHGLRQIHEIIRSTVEPATQALQSKFTRPP
jgi:iron complex transport system substrate-binding protein